MGFDGSQESIYEFIIIFMFFISRGREVGISFVS